ncbi:putative SED1-abundant cell surface glycoprotein [Fusarium austroafricanum]|uniref:Putative SED1-abundant cell surface glycoprotein n=1 Tax=Fusarium austroafricanum TaxID=2364996 RepID=A0A8H4KTM8_9HYPO|nr:putative SED1-abundant cell surface glycoprotein [Fusarium austroafricanum]
MVAIKVAAAGLLIGAAQASPYAPYGNNGTHYTTEVVTAITTYCPGATTLTYGDKTYTVTKETTLTITDCPCTVSYPVKPTHPVVPPVKYTTEVVTAVTTYCPEPTTLTYGNKTYTVTKPQTVTITDCHFTTTKPASEHPYPQPTPGKPGKPGQPEGPKPTAPAQPGKPSGPVPVPGNPTTAYPPPEGTNPAVVTAAAGRIAPAGILALIGAVALF